MMSAIVFPRKLISALVALSLALSIGQPAFSADGLEVSEDPVLKVQGMADEVYEILREVDGLDSVDGKPVDAASVERLRQRADEIRRRVAEIRTSRKNFWNFMPFVDKNSDLHAWFWLGGVLGGLGFFAPLVTLGGQICMPGRRRLRCSLQGCPSISR